MKVINNIRVSCLCCMYLFSGLNAFANNITVSNVCLVNQNTAEHYIMISFDISWENSWRIAAAQNNWDAAWIFIKYRIGTCPWNHAWLNNAGHINPAGCIIDTGLLKPDSSFHQITNPGLGVFLYREADGTGLFSETGVQLRWNYCANGLNENDIVDIKVNALEMVYVPEGNFYIGSGGNETSAFYKYPFTTDSYLITSESELIVGTENGNLYYSSSTYGGDRLGPIPGVFPKGFKAFYCMKYEISQQGYVDFLNSLTTTQASNHFQNFGSSFRYGISVTGGIYSTTKPFVACNYLNWSDLAAYLDWSGLRPLTELEFEKACRGEEMPVPNEYAWGTTGIAANQYALTNNGAYNENISANYSTTAGNAAYSLTTPYNGNINGPLRAGIFAGNTSNTDRVTAGATIYGIMEMSGNLLEHFVTAGNPTGRLFSGEHGNGNISSTGYADVVNWPPASSMGAGFRGGYWYYYAWYLRVSERSGAAGTDPARYSSDGGRGGRTAP